MFKLPFFPRALAMTICEYCGRVHQATAIDRRFCSLVCRMQYEQHPFFYQPAPLEEEQHQQGQMLRTHLIGLLKIAGQLLHQAETLSPEQQLHNQREWLTSITAQENSLLVLSSIFAEVPATPPPTAD